MKKTNPLKLKYADLYWQIAQAAKQQSVATRHQVGAVAVTPEGIVLLGWNGTIAGANNVCETGQWVEEEERYKTGFHVLHAENNLVNKALQAGISLDGAHLYITRFPCLACARMLVGSGITDIFYEELHDEGDALELLLLAEIRVTSRESQSALARMQNQTKDEPF